MFDFAIGEMYKAKESAHVQIPRRSFAADQKLSDQWQ